MVTTNQYEAYNDGQQRGKADFGSTWEFILLTTTVWHTFSDQYVSMGHVSAVRLL